MSKRGNRERNSIPRTIRFQLLLAVNLTLGLALTGHGVPAAMGAAMLKSLLLSAAERPPFDPVSVLQEVNRRFATTVLPGYVASMFLGRWRPDSCELSWASAGHEPGIPLSDDLTLALLQCGAASQIKDDT